jgi:hypothetical protein
MQDRLDHGNLTINEVCALKRRSKTGFCADVKAGLVEIEKIGRKSVVRGARKAIYRWRVGRGVSRGRLPTPRGPI